MRLRKSLMFLLVLLAAMAPYSFALDLQAAKERGLVGEMANGYLGSPAGKPAPEVAALIDDINRKRKAKYAQVAKNVGKPMAVIEQLAGEKAQAKTKAGNYIQTSGGRWVKK